jgi:hypothetical protein
MRVRDMEYQIPVPYLPRQAGEALKPDFSIIQRAWWDAINIVYDDAETPMRFALELRIMSGSDMILAPQAGNEWGTASIEVLTFPDAVKDGEWTGFCQKVSDKWMSYTDAEGRALNVRPHWAKEWYVLFYFANHHFSYYWCFCLRKGTLGSGIIHADSTQGNGRGTRSPGAGIPQNRGLQRRNPRI